MKELCKQIQVREKQLSDLLYFFSLDEIRSSPFNDVYRTAIKDLAHLYQKQEELIYSHFKTK